jgi:hypothetical protein
VSDVSIESIATAGAVLAFLLAGGWWHHEPTRHSVDRNRHAVLVANACQRGGAYVDCRPERES